MLSSSSSRFLPFSKPLLLRSSPMVASSSSSNSNNIMLAAARRSISTGQPKKVNVQSLVEADTGAVGTKYYHLGSTALLVAAPLALIASPSVLSFPMDLFLGVAFPLHGHVGFNYIITDYVPKASRPMARYVLMGVTGITILGLLKLNLTGPGLTETYKSLWREKVTEEKK